jgi:ABC-type nickel/cobalt efflux system permease component RcnA
LIGGGLLGLVILAGGAFLIGLVIAVIGGAIFYWQYKNLDKRRADIRQVLEKERDQALQILRACLAELVDLRREFAREDAKSNDVTEFLESLTSAQFILSGAQKQRAALAS